MLSSTATRTPTTLDGGEWSASRSGSSLPWERTPWYPLHRRLGRPHSCSVYRGWRTILCLCRESNPGRPICNQTLYQRFPNYGSHPPAGGGGTYMRNMFILNEIWAQDTMYILVGTFLSWNMKFALFCNLSITKVHAYIKLEKYVIH
jgi:hypothetical protein